MATKEKLISVKREPFCCDDRSRQKGYAWLGRKGPGKAPRPKDLIRRK